MRPPVTKTLAVWRGCVLLALLVGTAWANQPVASTAPASSGTHVPTTHHVPLFPDGDNDADRDGFIRIVSYSNEDGTLRIAAFDADGREFGPVTLSIGAGRTIHLDPDDLVQGNAAKGLSGPIGSGWGDGRLELSSELDVMVLSYIRHRDGFLTAVHDVAPREGNRYYLRTFNPGRESSQASRLRLINTNREPARVRIWGIDDRGDASGDVTVSVPAGATRELTAAQLESGAGMNGALGRGSGKWRLFIESQGHLAVMNLLENPTGYLANLSAVPRAGKGGAWDVPLFPGASDPRGRRGLVRIINRSARGGDVRIAAFDERQGRHAPFAMPIGAGQAVHLDSDDLEEELSPGAGSGEARRLLVATSDLDIEVLSYIEHPDGLLTSMYDVAPLAGHRVPTFVPDRDRRSRLRLVNTGDKAAQVAVRAVDDGGSSPGSALEATVPAGAAREFTAAQLGFGDGTGNWRLVIDSEETVQAMSLLEGPNGHLANLSTEPRRDPVPVEDHWMETSRGNPAGVVVSVVDGRGFAPGLHGQRITDTFLDHTRHASLVQIDGWGTYALNGSVAAGTNAGGFVRHGLTRDGGIVWTATDDAQLYQPHRARRWFVKHGRPFWRDTRELANWMRDRDVLVISSLENATCALTPQGCDAVYCDDFELDEEDVWIPLCGLFDDYVAHSGVGLDTVLFAGALSGDAASGAIRADGVFAPHTIYVESPDGSTSHATPVLAAYATNLSSANASWSAARLKRELMELAREESVMYYTGGINSVGTSLTERRTVRAIRPPGPAGGDTRPPVGPENGATFTDHPLSPGVTPVRAVHFMELRERIDALRAAAALRRFRWTDPVLRAGVTPVRLVHLTELRTALEAAHTAAGRPVPRWTDTAPVRGKTPIRAVHLTELRDAVVALEE